MRRWSTFVELAFNFFNFFKMLFRHWANGHLLEILCAYQQLFTTDDLEQGSTFRGCFLINDVYGWMFIYSLGTPKKTKKKLKNWWIQICLLRHSSGIFAHIGKRSAGSFAPKNVKRCLVRRTFCNLSMLGQMLPKALSRHQVSESGDVVLFSCFEVKSHSWWTSIVLSPGVQLNLSRSHSFP